MSLRRRRGGEEDLLRSSIRRDQGWEVKKKGSEGD